ncbi:MAG: DHHA1 domain-containing protein [Anaerolineae bacterium]
MADVKTERLYYNDSYTTEFDAHILDQQEYEGTLAIALDRTYFYPTGGGQPNDTGTIDGVRVVDVFSRDEAVYHVLAEPIQTGEAAVHCAIDWQRRFDHMQQHTGQHILSQSFIQAAGAGTVGFHLSGETLTIDLDKVISDENTLAQVEALANAMVIRNIPVTARLIDPSELEKHGVRMRKLPEQIHTDGLRVVFIGDFDATACGGTHVARTGEIGLIKIVKVEKKGDKGRVEFRCGARALRDYREKHAIVAQLAADFTCGSAEVPDAIARLRDDLQSAQRALKAATTQLIQLEAAQTIAQTESVNGVRLIVKAFDQRALDEVKLLASLLIETPGTIALVGTSGEKAQLFLARSADLPQNLNPILKAALETFGGRGGGQPGFVQGGGVKATVEQIQRALETAAASLKPAF